MRVRIHRHIADLAGSGLVLIGFLLATMALSAAPVLVQEMNRRPAQSQPGGRSDRPVSGVNGAHAPW
jgi:hypothetical protein